MSDRKFSIYLPILLAFTLAAGFLIGRYAFSGKPGGPNGGLFSQTKGYDKFNDVLNFIDENYVDTINRSQITDLAIDDLLQRLDPHSYYIPASELQKTNESLSGNFDGIGVEFNIQKDTIMVINTISGGPAQQKGVQPGDRIVKIDGKNVAGVHISNNEVFKKLRGKKGTTVKVSVFRKNVKGLINIDIVRDKITEKSLDVFYMIDRKTAFVKLSKFTGTSFKEFDNASRQLLKKGMKVMILDLRGNGGGLLNTAVKIADEFLAEGKMIVYTQGKSKPKEEYVATSEGLLGNTGVIILIDEWSASASEILAGAIQDNDRGIVIGRRSFGKGLVQEQAELPDGSALRLTVARYYTPTGRCIQRPYHESIDAYYTDLLNRITDKEAEKKYDSLMKKDSGKKYKTPKGKVVYGGGGIRPDIMVALDTSRFPAVFTDVINRGLVNQFGFDYADKNRESLKRRYTNAPTFVRSFQIDAVIWAAFVELLKKNKVNFTEASLLAAKKDFDIYIKAFIARHIVGDEGFYTLIFSQDKVYIQAIREASKMSY
ncbi:MAG: S41 family peptidase [Bacteroidota bacterium]